MSRKRGGGTDDPRWRSRVEPAPGELRIVQALINTAGGRSEEGSGALADWLRRWNLLDPGSELGPKDLEEVREVRSGLRSLIGANRGPVPAAEVLEALDRAAATAPIRVRFTGGVRFEPLAGGLAEVVARLFEIVASAHRDGLWQRLGLCAREDCGAAFYDYSNARSAKWCSAKCGGKGSSRTYRQRRKRYKERTREERPPAS